MFEWLDTPQVLIEKAIMDRNLKAMQDRATALGKRLRPHSKTHKSPELARQQLAWGADGIMVAKLDEASVMLSQGIAEQSVGYPIIGPIKAARLAELMLRGLRPRVSVDSSEGISLLQAIGSKLGRAIEVLIEVNTGLNRAGLSQPPLVVAMAERIARQSHVHFKGLTCFGGHIGKQGSLDATIAEIEAEDAMLRSLAGDLNRAHLPPEVVSQGGSIVAHFAEHLRVATELRPGTYIFNDIATVQAHAAQLADCAATILSTVVSIQREWAVVDAGSKSLSTDGTREGGFGHILGRPDLRVLRLSEEHGIVARVDGGPVSLAIGERLRIIPNHICTAINLHRMALLVRDEEVLGSVAILAAGGVH